MFTSRPALNDFLSHSAEDLCVLSG